MPWSNSRPRGKRYDAQHAKTRAEHMAALKRAGEGVCAEVVCIKPSRRITPAMDLHLCHDHKTGRILGLGHRACNQHEASVRARALQTETTLRW